MTVPTLNATCGTDRAARATCHQNPEGSRLSEHGGTEEFEAVYGRQWQPMVRLAALTTGSTAIAEEIVQDAFIGLYRHLSLASLMGPPGRQCDGTGLGCSASAG